MCENKASFQSMKAIGFIEGHNVFAVRKANSLLQTVQGK